MALGKLTEYCLNCSLTKWTITIKLWTPKPLVQFFAHPMIQWCSVHAVKTTVFCTIYFITFQIKMRTFFALILSLSEWKMSQKVKVKWDKERMIVEFGDGPKSKRSRVQEFKIKRLLKHSLDWVCPKFLDIRASFS